MSSGGFLWVLLGSGGFLWVLVGSGGFLWVVVGSCEFWWVLVGSCGLSWVLVGSGGLSWVLVGLCLFPHQNSLELIRTQSPQNPVPPSEPTIMHSASMYHLASFVRFAS